MMAAPLTKGRLEALSSAMDLLSLPVRRWHSRVLLT